MSPALNGSSALQRFERSDAIKIRNRIMFDFYPGLSHMLSVSILTWLTQLSLLLLNPTLKQNISSFLLMLLTNYCQWMMFTHTLINIITGEASIFVYISILQFVVANPRYHVIMSTWLNIRFFLNNASLLWNEGDQERYFINVLTKWFSCYNITN